MKAIFWIFLATILVSSISCNDTQRQKRILYINSYHEGYPTSDKVCAVIRDSVMSWGDSLKIIYMDCKRNPSSDFAEKKAESIYKEIENFKPDGILVSDDDAVKYVVEPYLKDSCDIPIVFCGVNWECEQYGLPCSNITGVLEVLPLESLLNRVRLLYPDAKKIAILSENTVSERNNCRILDTLYRKLQLEPTYFLVDDFDEWSENFIQLNKDFDIIYMPTNGAVKGWDSIVAKKIVYENIKKPVVTCDDFMMPYCVFGLTKVAEEQAVIALRMLTDIFGGNKSPEDIPVEKNKQGKAWLNSVLAGKILLDVNVLSDLKPEIVN